MSHLHEVEQRANNPDLKRRGPLGITALSCSDWISVCITQGGESLSLTCCLVTHSQGRALSFTHSNKELNQSGNLVQLQHEKVYLFICLIHLLIISSFVLWDVSFMHHIETVIVMWQRDKRIAVILLLIMFSKETVCLPMQNMLLKRFYAIAWQSLGSSFKGNSRY